MHKGRKVLFPLVFHAGAGGVANFVTTRERKEDDSCLGFRVYRLSLSLTLNRGFATLTSDSVAINRTVGALTVFVLVIVIVFVLYIAKLFINDAISSQILADMVKICYLCGTIVAYINKNCHRFLVEEDTWNNTFP